MIEESKKLKVKRKTFRYNDDYFEFYDRNKNKINIISLKILADKIVLEYEELIDDKERYKELKTKLAATTDNRQLMIAELNKREKQLNCPYKNRRYTEEELQKILKGV